MTYWGAKNIRDGVCDMISIGRQSLADPLLRAKLEAGREEDVNWCTCCDNCLEFLIRQVPVGCATHEDEYTQELKGVRQEKGRLTETTPRGVSLAGCARGRAALLRQVEGWPGMTILEMRGIRKSFHGVEVLRSVDFALEQGEVMGLCGENGAGQATLMKIISGIHPQDRDGSSAARVPRGRPPRL